MSLDTGEQHIVWRPAESDIATAHLTAVLADNGFSSYEELTQVLLRDDAAFERFYTLLLQRLDLTWSKPGSKLLNTARGVPFAEWFFGAEYNATENALDRWIARGRGEYVALTYESEAGDVQHYTYRALQQEVADFAAALTQIGVCKGMTVGIWMPMLPEAVIALLALGYLGAIAVPAFSGYGVAALATRLNDARANIVLTVSSMQRRGKKIDMTEILCETLLQTPAVQKIVMLLTNDQAAQQMQDEDVPSALETSLRRKGRNVHILHWRQLLADTRRLLRSGQAAPFSRIRTQANDPYLLLYTSGSTGRPKGVVHTHAGFPIKVAIDQFLCFDVNPGERMLWYTDMGWMMGPFLVFGALTLGASIVLYDGTPDYPSPDRLWALCARHRVTHLGLAPTVVRALAAQGDEWPAAHDLQHVRMFGSSGEAWNTAPYRWLCEYVGRNRAPIINYSGGTEIGGGILGCFPTMPLAPNAFHGPIPGMRADVCDDEGRSVRGRVGELILRAPWPGMTQSFWGGSALARDDARYLQAYWERLPNVWTHGDWAEVATFDADGISREFWYIRGRSDDTINVAGKRIGPAEFESVLVSHPKVKEAVAVAVPDAIKGDVVVCFVVVKQPVDECEVLRADLFQAIDHAMGHALRPKAIRFVDDIPKTRNQKIMRRIARAVYLALPELGDTSGLENIASLQAIRHSR